MATHEKNKSQVVESPRSEVVLFVVDARHQGKGVWEEVMARLSSLSRGVLKISCQSDKIISRTENERRSRF